LLAKINGPLSMMTKKNPWLYIHLWNG
jgi:hypothetical protein